MDRDSRLAALRQQIEEANDGQPTDFKGWEQRTRATVRAVMGADHPSNQQVARARYGPMMWSESTPEHVFANAKASGVRSVIAILEGAIHEIALTAPTGPAVSVTGLHSWVAGAAAGLWDDGHHRQAVDEAARAIEIRMKAKIGKDLTGYALVTEAFNTDPPKAGGRRLRFEGFDEGTQAWTDAHRGAMHFAQGCMLRIRNLAEHHDEVMTPQVATECLAALSLLARWTDDSVVVEG